MGMPCLGQRFQTDQLVVDLNEANPFEVDFSCPDLTFSLQLGVRDYSIGIDSDKLVRRLLPAGAITVSPAGSAVKAITEDRSPEFLAFSLKQAFVEEAIEDTSLAGSSIPVVPDLRHPDFVVFADLIQRFLASSGGRTPIYAETLCLGLLHTMFTEIAGGAEEAAHAPRLSDRDFQRVLEYIEAHLAHPIGLQDLARVSGQKMKAFSLAFRERTGFAPYAYVLKRRVETARDMIRATDLPIIEIAYTCGFSSQAHMTSTFKQRLGVTPGRIRQNR